MAFYCSIDHWEAGKHDHTREPCEDGHDGLTQCQMHQEIRADIGFSEVLVGLESPSGSFQWAPERVKPAWESLSGGSWWGEFEADLVRLLDFPRPAVPAILRAASDGLSMPMTILSALENLNRDDQWTRRNTLTIHVSPIAVEATCHSTDSYKIIGASEKEVQYGQIFEEILHRLPAVKALKVSV